MQYLLFFLAVLLILCVGSCSSSATESFIPEQSVSIHSADPLKPEPASSPEKEPASYSGVTIDQLFPAKHHTSFVGNPENRGDSRFEIDRYAIRANHFVPISIEREDRSVYRFPRRESGGYWATLAGVSSLRGANSKEIYVAVSGPGGVCCTNYTIVDISSKTPRTIYHSEDFGRFRDAMEIFDEDGDGIYELVQFDSCLRYFRDDCGSCSPEPRVYFTYSKELGRYLPAKGIVQDFVRRGYARSEKWIGEKYAEWTLSKDLGTQVDLRRSLIAHIADLLHVGEERKAWSLFTRYSGVVDRDDKRELKFRLGKCKAYKMLARAN